MRELERDFQNWILDVAKRGGWRVWHSPMPVRPIGGNRFIPDPRGRGLPDLFMLHDDPPRMIIAEIKSDTGKIGEAQEEFFRLARAVAREADGITMVGGEIETYRPVQAFVWRPANRELIEQVLLGRLSGNRLAVA